MLLKFGLRSFKLDDRGMILAIILCFCSLIGIGVLGIALYAANTARQVKVQEDYLKMFYTAEAVTERSVAQIKNFIAQNGTVPTGAQLAALKAVSMNTGNAYSYKDTSNNSTLSMVYSGGVVTKVLTSGDYAGLSGSVQTVNISVTSRDTQSGHPATVSLAQSVEIQLIPLFQFGVFYQNDLEILPGATMTFSGPVHSNANMYFGTDATLNFASAITAAGNIYHSRKDGTTEALGNIFIKDPSGVDQNMKNSDGTWLDSNSGDWLLGSQSRWGGNVQSQVHGVAALNLPLPTGSNSHTLVERRSGSDSSQVQAQKMDYKANLRIIDGSVMNQSGSTVELRYCSGGGTFNGTSCPGGQSVINPVTATTFYNYREGKTVQSTDLNVSQLNNSPNFQSIMSSSPNGVIIYTSDHRNEGSSTKQDAVRLVSGSTLPSHGLTVASENPLYVKGDYNTVNKQPSGLVGDSFNILSNAWNDSNSSSGLSSRTASNTMINSTVIAGNTNTVSDQYNGGFENLPRFLENWTGRNMTYSGSTIVLYNSQYATGNWIYGGNYYTAPNRLWFYDTALSDPNYQIPGFPSVYNVAKSSFEQT